MSRITSDKISLGDSVVVDFFTDEDLACGDVKEEQESEPEVSPQVLAKLDLLEKEPQDKAQRIVEEANEKSSQILSDASFEAEKIINEAQVKADELEKNANELIEKAKSESEQIVLQANQQAHEISLEASQSGAKEGYEAGYKDGLNKIKEELIQKIYGMDEIVRNTFEIKQKILKSSKDEIINLVLMIAKKISLESVNAKAVATLVSKSLSLLTDKENIELILSEKYAKLINEVLNGSLGEDLENDEIDIDKLKNIKLTYNSKFCDDTLIIQTPKERLDLSFESQLNQISNEFLKELNSSDNDDEGEIIG